MALTEYDKKNLSTADQKKIQDATDKWNAANAKGDKAGMDAAAAEAAAVRNNAGYKTDSSGNYAGGTSNGGSSNYSPYSQSNYTIGSDYGKQQAQNMGIGTNWTATDGSIWRKENDGTITVDYNGQLYKNAWTPSDYGILGQQQIDAGVGWRDVLNTYNSRQNKALNTEGLGEFANDPVQQMMWQYIQDKMQEENLQAAQDKYNDWLQDYNQNNPQPTAPESNPRIDRLLNKILNRDDFSYDAMSDPLYQQYKEMYQREGDRAMRDTLAQAAAGAGGMNSYAITAASQANNHYNSQLNDRIPELYQLAYEMYLNDKESMVQDLGILQDMDATQYNRYRDTMNDWYKDKSFAYGAYQDAVNQGNWQTNFDYNSMWDNITFNDESYWNEKDWNATQEQVALENSRREQADAEEDVKWYISMGMTPPPELVEKSGIPQETVDKLIQKVLAGEISPASVGSGSSSRGSSSSNGSSGDDSSSSSSSNSKQGTNVFGLGVGPASDSTMYELAINGAVTVHSDGSYSWANGYNKDNYQKALDNDKVTSYSLFPTFTTYPTLYDQYKW